MTILPLAAFLQLALGVLLYWSHSAGPKGWLLIPFGVGVGVFAMALGWIRAPARRAVAAVVLTTVVQYATALVCFNTWGT